MDRLTSKRLYETLQSNNSVKQYLNLAPDLKQPKITSPANGIQSPLKNALKRSLPNNSSSLPS